MVDIGCGDGRFLFKCAEYTKAKIIGIDINENRIEEVNQQILSLKLSNNCEAIHANALEIDFSAATVIFLYLIPRGLKLILPQILNISHKVRIVTYMTPFSGPIELKFKQKIKVIVGEQTIVEYPIYYYETNNHI